MRTMALLHPLRGRLLVGLLVALVGAVLAWPTLLWHPAVPEPASYAVAGPVLLVGDPATPGSLRLQAGGDGDPVPEDGSGLQLSLGTPSLSATTGAAALAGTGLLVLVVAGIGAGVGTRGARPV